MGEDVTREGLDDTQRTRGTDDEVSFRLPDNFMDEVRGSIEGAMSQVVEALPSLSDILAQAQGLPGVRIDRASYLDEVLAKRPAQVRARAIETTPRDAGITVRELSKLARRQQGREARRTTVLSFAAGFAGGAAAAATIPADLVQFYGHLMRMIQMLTYLFGWRDLCRMAEGEMDEATRRAYLLFLGVMAGDEVADEVLARYARQRADVDLARVIVCDERMEEVEARLAERATRRLGGQVVGKSVPIAGAIISSTISYGGFSDMCTRLRKQLERLG